MTDAFNELHNALNDTSKKDSTPKKQKKQIVQLEKKERLNPDVIQLKDRGNIDYDVDMVREFINTVFHKLEPEDNILTWTPKGNTPAFPKSLDKTFKLLEHTNLPKVFYYGTSTTVPDEDGKLKNRKALFTGLHVIVLDDIGTKIPLDRLPEDLEPNYIIESSEGNFQYGFILDEPIRDLALAEAMIQLIYTSGLSDSGGKLPNKLVRLPCGINGKAGEKGDFRVRLNELNDEYWSPAELLDVMDVGVTWDDLLEDVNNANRGLASTRVGTSLWSPIKPQAASLDGVVDPLLEWLYENDMVSNDNGEWVEVQCPWHNEHSTGGMTAGYNPVGRGGKYSKNRTFHCFHGSCQARTIHDFLEVMADNGAPQVPVRDMVADLVADYAYMSSEDSVVRIRGVVNPTHMKIGAFRNTYPRTAMVYEENGKLAKIQEHKLWLLAPNRVTLAGRLYDPTQNTRITTFDNQNYLNTFTAPTWGRGSFRQEDVDKFNDFIEYLIPNEKERDYFLQWLAAKAQNVTFKGAAILMVAPTQGTGRTTLTDMMEQLFSSANVRKVNFDTLCSAGDAGAFNDWQESIMVTCDEVMQGGGNNKFKVYEGLKDLFDPKPKQTLVNTKYGMQRQVTLYTSYLLLTNHTDAIGALGEDRRVYTIQNTISRNTPEYYSALLEWLDERDEQGERRWARSIWRWLQTLNPDIEMLNSPAPMTAAKKEMIESTSSICDVLHEIISDELGAVVSPSVLKDIAEDVLFERNVDNIDNLLNIVVKKSRSASVSVELLPDVKPTVKVNGKSHRMRLTHKYMKDNGYNAPENIDETTAELLVIEAKKSTAEAMDNPKKFVERVNAVLDERGL